MIGNDIVDIAIAMAESNPLRLGWIDKVFATSERELIFGCDAPLQTIWLLWAMKEASYKVYNRSSGKIFYAPHRFICELQELNAYSATGTVTFDGYEFFTKSTISPRFLHSVATMVQDEVPQINIRPLSVSRSDMLPPGCQFIRQGGSPPVLLHKQTQSYIPVSYSHHGDWHALVFTPTIKLNDYEKI